MSLSPLSLSSTSIPAQLSKRTKTYSQALLGTLDKSYDIKIALLDGPLIFHSHPDNDEAFYLVSGSLVIEIQEEGQIKEVVMKEGDLYVVPRGVQHRPIGTTARVIVIEKCGVRDGSGTLRSRLVCLGAELR